MGSVRGLWGRGLGICLLLDVNGLSEFKWGEKNQAVKKTKFDLCGILLDENKFSNQKLGR